ncbi:hypothetical protein ACFOQM_23410 [Paenibacillus sp. GCM10012307]|uniref:Uncharacterized protein n=1 Tax=Paenibacillus roseus TaxID=2798579 RepID=A0A934J9T3_9BACL|nr:hypothetical protein [Paenibacillus roseus]MBJ6364173.1 hypothetical protein [Paenibacillus roseus]
MSKPVKLSKFPVTSPSGAEYRVTIKYDSVIIGDYKGNEVWRVYIYEKRNTWGPFRFKCTGRYQADYSDYSDLVELASYAVLEYEEDVETEKRENIKKAELSRKQAEAIGAFRNWDGKITKTTEEAV